MSKTKKQKSRDGVSYLGLTENGQRRFLVRYSVTVDGAKREREKTITARDKADAITQRSALIESFRGELQGTESSEHLSAIIAEWLPTLRHATRLTYKSLIKRLEGAMGTRPITSITAQELQKLFADVKGSDNVANDLRKATKSLFAWAKGQGKIAVDVAAQTTRRQTPESDEERWRRAREPPARKHMLSAELEKFTHAFESRHPELYMLVMTQLMLGCRIGEAIALEWEDIDLETGRVIIRNNFHARVVGAPKNGEARETALGPLWLARLREHRARLIAEQRRGIEKLCFPALPDNRHGDIYWRYHTVRDKFERVYRDCGITLAKRTVTHALRHTMSSLAQLDNAELVARRFLGAGGATAPADLQRALGHASPAMTDRYSHVGEGRLIDFAKEVEKRVPLRERSQGGSTGGS